MIYVYFYNFSKDTNSTKQPASTDTKTTLQCSLLDATSVVNPTLAIYNGITSDPTWNYCYIPEFNRYYVVRDWVWQNSNWVCYLNCDVLATYRTQIGNSTQYVIRSSADFEGTIIDTYYPMKTRPFYTKLAQDTASTSFVSSVTAGRFVIGIFNKTTSSVGCVSYYMMTNAQFRSFVSNLMSNIIDAMDVEEVSSGLLKALFNPMQYIASCVWLPLVTAYPGSTSVTSMDFGYWSITLPQGATLLNTISTTALISFSNIPHHPQSTRGYYLRSAPYSQYKLIIPALGTFTVPSELLYDSTSLSADFRIDVSTGAATMTINAVNSLISASVAAQTYQVQVGVPVAIAQLTQDLVSAGVDVVSSVASIASGNVLGAVSGVASAITGVLAPQVTTINQNGNFAGFYDSPYMICEFHEIADEANNRYGRPLCKYVQISTLAADSTQSGYIIVEDAEIEIACTAEEMNSVKQAMESGFYYV